MIYMLWLISLGCVAHGVKLFSGNLLEGIGTGTDVAFIFVLFFLQLGATLVAVKYDKTKKM